MPKISTITLDKNGDFPSHAWPGGYPIIYFNCREDVLCPTCANKSIDLDSFDFCPTDFDVYYEGPALECDCCGTLIESAYGDPDKEEREEEQEEQEEQEEEKKLEHDTWLEHGNPRDYEANLERYWQAYDRAKAIRKGEI